MIQMRIARRFQNIWIEIMEKNDDNVWTILLL